MKINIVLADAGTQDPLGKLNLLGVGWAQTQVNPNGLTPDSAVAVLMEAPWDMCNRELTVILELLTEDDSPVPIPVESGPQPLKIVHRLTIPSPPGAPNGSPGTANLLAQFHGGLPLQPGAWYHWRVQVEGKTDPMWIARFYVRRQPTAPTLGVAEEFA